MDLASHAPPPPCKSTTQIKKMVWVFYLLTGAESILFHRDKGPVPLVISKNLFGQPEPGPPGSLNSQAYIIGTWIKHPILPSGVILKLQLIVAVV